MAATLFSPRLHLRGFVLDDAERVRQLAGDAAVADTASNIPHPYLPGMAEAWISAQLTGEEGEITWAVTCRSSNVLMGCLGLVNVSLDGQEAELGYWIGRDYWSKGYASEAVALVIDSLFLSQPQLLRITASCYKRNAASARVLEKCGLLGVGERLGQPGREGRVEDFLLFALERPQWQALQAQ